MDRIGYHDRLVDHNIVINDHLRWWLAMVLTWVKPIACGLHRIELLPPCILRRQDKVILENRNRLVVLALCRLGRERVIRVGCCWLGGEEAIVLLLLLLGVLGVEAAASLVQRDYMYPGLRHMRLWADQQTRWSRHYRCIILRTTVANQAIIQSWVKPIGTVLLLLLISPIQRKQVAIQLLLSIILSSIFDWDQGIDVGHLDLAVDMLLGRDGGVV